jgi:hypothetical protein
MNRRNYVFIFICCALSSSRAHVKNNRKFLYFICKLCVTYIFLKIEIVKAVTGGYFIKNYNHNYNRKENDIYFLSIVILPLSKKSHDIILIV